MPTLLCMDGPRTEEAGNLVSSRHLDDPVRQQDLSRATEDAWAALENVTARHTSRTLVKQERLRVVLMVLKKGEIVPEHTAEGDQTVQVLRGRVALNVDGQRFRVHAGHLLAIEHELPHTLEALEDSEVLLTLSWPPP